MPRTDFSLALIVPTKDRPESLRRLLASLAVHPPIPEQVIVVNAGSVECRGVTGEFPRLNVGYVRCPGCSAAAARNAGLTALTPNIELVGFMDDDNEVGPGVLEAMLSFWSTASAEVGGAGFNIRHVATTKLRRLLPLGGWLHRKFQSTGGALGSVPRSGFPRRYYPVAETTEVEWLDTFAAVFRREVVEHFKFDEFFAGYSYLEFLDYTYAISRKYRLYILKEACVTNYHYPRRERYVFGKKQVINRIYFVRKHKGLSLWRCSIMLVLQMLFNITIGVSHPGSGAFTQGLGNLAGLAQALMGRVRPVPDGLG